MSVNHASFLGRFSYWNTLGWKYSNTFHSNVSKHSGKDAFRGTVKMDKLKKYNNVFTGSFYIGINNKKKIKKIKK